MKRLSILIAAFILLSFSFGSLAQQNGYDLFQKALAKERGEGNLEEAIALYQKVIDETKDKSLAAKAQLRIGICLEKLGQKKAKEAQKAYQMVIDNYPGQTETVRIAKEKLAVLLRAQAVVKKGDKELRMRKVWSGSGVDDSGKPSPDGKYLSFVDWSSGDLAIREIDTGKKRRITNKGSWDKSYEFATDSVWSPDGKRLAYGWYNKDSYIELRIIGIDDSEPHILYKGKDEWIFPADWSPDGKDVLVYLVRGDYKTFQFGKISVEDGSFQVLKTVKNYPRNMSFTQDSKYIVYDYPQAEESQAHDIFLLSIDGKQDTPIVKHPADDWVLGSVPNSNIILFSSDRTGTHDAWMIEVKDGKPLGDPKLIRKELGQISPLGFASSGAFYYSFGTGMVDVYIASLDLEKGKVLVPPKKITQRFVGSNYMPDWSRDGKYLAYISERKFGPGGPGSHVLCIRSDETGEIRMLFPKLKSFGRLRWAPDGHSIFVTGSDEKVFLGLYRIDVQTGELTLIAESEPGANIKDFTFSLDGKSVFYAYFEFSKMRVRILKHDLETGHVQEVYRKDAPPDIGKLSVSPDGEYLAFVTAEPGWPWFVRVIPLEGGEHRDILKMKPDGINTFAWTPDGNEILFVKDVSSGKGRQACELWHVPAEGGEPQKFDIAMEGTHRLSIHPDGNRIAFHSGKSRAEIWVMENFLPEEKKEKGGQR